ncbi:LAME_0F09868g1_1 [Lachancea meyersii CBS 8951]|uniref:Pre-mRNA-splicing factor SYF2 n=1 Tax=Lachancea meyersii CBS 8951 TaxID=1266667 RepID=A0A1G4JV67_9SACH|nr:LAME_0F09868g1_1 [Lachancea meyersii CBS 8951]
MNVDKYASRLKNLKRQRVNLAVKNRKEVNGEEKLRQRTQKPAVYSMNEEDVDAGEAVEATKAAELGSGSNGQLFAYSISEYEQWEDREQRKKGTDSGQYRDLAKATYNKEVQQIVSRLNDSGKKVDKRTATLNTKGKIVVDDNPELVSELAGLLERNTKERYAKTQKKLGRRNATETPATSTSTTTSTGFVNEKNKQFNEKLDRQAKRLEQLGSTPRNWAP